LTEANTLAYYDTATITAVKSFLEQVPGVGLNLTIAIFLPFIGRGLQTSTFILAPNHSANLLFYQMLILPTVKEKNSAY
jgi:hypothetical protein